ncbi:MAG: hypothetical protein Q8S21_03515 [Candidatus Paracaedibacteraceae bacterium]|nr:hypothetical protein [Candidatus Paracaedibacteraceae bacterium]
MRKNCKVKLNDISENKYILLRELQNKIFDAINKADYVAKNFDRDTSSYYTQMKLKTARAGQMARSGMDAASEYSSKAYNTASDYSSKAYNSEMAAQAGSMARGTAAVASDMASQAYNSETAKKMGDGVRSMGTAMGIPKMSSWSFGKRKEVAE